jgi:ABC-type lipoprotein export system ATPase subunit
MIKLQNIYKEYQLDGEVFTALKNIILEIDKGEFTAIIGPSGSGKSTLMHVIGLLDHPSRGKIFIEDNDASKLNDDQLSKLRNEFIGFVFQQFNLINKLTVLENVLLPTIYTRIKLDFDPKEKVTQLIKRFGLEGKENSYPNKISGGEQQRVAIARALITSPKIILADEPTGNLDTKTGDKILNLLKELNRKDGLTVIIVTHEKDVAEKTRRKIQMRDGEII